MTRSATLPLGIDIGSRRVRVALSARERGGQPKLIAVAAREHGGDPVAALSAAHAELQTPERRCVLALAAPDALLCSAEFPPMSRWERARAARFEAARFIDYPIAEAAVSIVPADAPGRWTIGIARRSTLASALAAAKGARLRTLGVDDAAFALRRAHPTAGGVIDIGDDATRVTVFGRAVPFVAHVPIGGAALTGAIADALGISLDEAEARKRTLGFGGAGDEFCATLIAEIAEALSAARTAGCAAPADLVLCGNGSRIPGFAVRLQHAAGVALHSATLSADVSDTVPHDVLRTAAADWSVAYGLCLWNGAT